MTAQNRHDRLIKRPKTRYPQIPFQEREINQNRKMILYTPSFIETIDICLD